MWVTWTLAVFGLMNRTSAISAFELAGGDEFEDLPLARRQAEDLGRAACRRLRHCMRKALSLVWGVWRNGRDFDPNWGLET